MASVQMTGAEVDFTAPAGTTVGLHRFFLTPSGGGTPITLDAQGLTVTFVNVAAMDYHTSCATLDANTGAQIGPTANGPDIPVSAFSTPVRIVGTLTVTVTP